MPIDNCRVLFSICEFYLSSTLENYQSFISLNIVFVAHFFSPLIKLILALVYLLLSLLVSYTFYISFSLYTAFWVTSYGLFSSSAILSFALYSLLLNIPEFLNLGIVFPGFFCIGGLQFILFISLEIFSILTIFL